MSYLGSTGRIASRIAEDWRTILRNDPEAREQRVEREAAELAREEREALHRWEYRVEEVRQTMIGEKVDVEGMALLLNDRAHHGWRVKSIVSASIVGRARPGLLIVFERRR